MVCGLIAWDDRTICFMVHIINGFGNHDKAGALNRYFDGSEVEEKPLAAVSTSHRPLA